MVGERRVVGRRSSVSAGGRITSANPGMSSEKQSENLCRRKPKISGTRFVLSWLGGPKPRPRGVGDGQTVDIPSPVRHVFVSASVGQPTFYWMEDVIYNQGMTRGLSPKWWNLNGPEKLAN